MKVPFGFGFSPFNGHFRRNENGDGRLGIITGKRYLAHEATLGLMSRSGCTGIFVTTRGSVHRLVPV
jgi:hypothetical protein